MSRIYVPSTLERLREALATGLVEVPEQVVRAESESEEDEYAAMLAAAEHSAAVLSGPGRRVVLVAETAATGDFHIQDLVAVHADVEPIDPTDDDPPELAWYAVQELDDLVRVPSGSLGRDGDL